MFSAKNITGESDSEVLNCVHEQNYLLQKFYGK